MPSGLVRATLRGHRPALAGGVTTLFAATGAGVPTATIPRRHRGEPRRQPQLPPARRATEILPAA
ncbi:hypothetical protein [Streptomyces halobius]|uniref:Uncharacterized protein n=1 Tax=Streptomyces halobius TaxID=2879846 RepID=A0ABY4MIT5_9ACTN|nr:hypothetical protein [Streptomyces halobius]UQA96241.1 hypothetical protein K9S39_34105 [Streptomyces halobius]